VLQLDECSEVDEFEAVVGGVCVCVLVGCKAMNDDNVLSGRVICKWEVLMAVVIDIWR
jgi:hypothetical protein